MIQNLIEHKDQNDYDICWFLTSFFECSLEYDITKAQCKYIQQNMILNIKIY